MDDRDNRRAENRFELYAVVNLKRNMRLTYCTIKLLTDMKHRAASLRQQGYLLVKQ